MMGSCSSVEFSSPPPFLNFNICIISYQLQKVNEINAFSTNLLIINIDLQIYNTIFRAAWQQKTIKYIYKTRKTWYNNDAKQKTNNDLKENALFL